jgi:putative transposase
MRIKTKNFIAEFALRTTAADERTLGVRLEAARQVYNTCLDEALKRLGLMRQSKVWQAAREMPKGAERTAIFKAVIARFDFTSAAIQKHAEGCRDACWIGDHLGSHDTQTTSLRAFRAVQQCAFGKRGRPRFKSFRRLNCVEGKGDAVIMLRKVDDAPVVLWNGLSLPLLLDPRDRDAWQRQGLACRTKYVRILRRTVRGRTRWYCQLVQEGLPPRKDRRPIGDGVVGLDLGPSTIAAVSAGDATLEMFCPSVAHCGKELRVAQRALDRSRRATNPDPSMPTAPSSAAPALRCGRTATGGKRPPRPSSSASWRPSVNENTANSPTACSPKATSSRRRRSAIEAFRRTSAEVLDGGRRRCSSRSSSARPKVPAPR